MLIRVEHKKFYGLGARHPFRKHFVVQGRKQEIKKAEDLPIYVNTCTLIVCVSTVESHHVISTVP